MRSVDNSVNGSRKSGAVSSLGRGSYEQQVALDRHPATASQNKYQRQQKSKLNKMKVATWNIRTGYQSGKLANIEKEMERLKIDIMGIAELRWPGAGEIITGEGNKVLYSGGETPNRGVGIIMKRIIANKLIGCWPVSDRIIMMKLKGTPFNINVFQLYAQTEDSTEEELENFYEKLTKAREQCKEHEINIIMGDLNAKVGRGKAG